MPPERLSLTEHNGTDYHLTSPDDERGKVADFPRTTKERGATSTALEMIEAYQRPTPTTKPEHQTEGTNRERRTSESTGEPLQDEPRRGDISEGVSLVFLSPMERRATPETVETQPPPRERHGARFDPLRVGFLVGVIKATDKAQRVRGTGESNPRPWRKRTPTAPTR